MQTDTLYSNWSITPWSSAPNPCCSWSRLCRNVLLIASKWLGFFFFFEKHLRIVFCVTDRQTLHFNYTLTHSFSPLVNFWYAIATLTLLPLLWLCVHFILCLSIHFFSAKSLLQAVVPLMAARQNCANPFCKGITSRCSVSSQETVCISL